MVQLAAEGPLELERLQYPGMLVLADAVAQLVTQHDQLVQERC